MSLYARYLYKDLKNISNFSNINGVIETPELTDGLGSFKM